MNNENKPPKTRKLSSLRHIKAVAVERTKHQPDVPPPEQVQQLLQEIIHPLTFSLVKLYSDMGLRQRTLNLYHFHGVGEAKFLSKFSGET